MVIVQRGGLDERLQILVQVGQTHQQIVADQKRASQHASHTSRGQHQTEQKRHRTKEDQLGEQGQERAREFQPGQVHPCTLRREHPTQPACKEYQQHCRQKAQHPPPEKTHATDRIGHDQVEDALLLVAHQEPGAHTDGKDTNDDRHVLKVVDIQIAFRGGYGRKTAEKGRKIFRIRCHQIRKALNTHDRIEHRSHQQAI